MRAFLFGLLAVAAADDPKKADPPAVNLRQQIAETEKNLAELRAKLEELEGKPTDRPALIFPKGAPRGFFPGNDPGGLGLSQLRRTNDPPKKGEPGDKAEKPEPAKPKPWPKGVVLGEAKRPAVLASGRLIMAEANKSTRDYLKYLANGGIVELTAETPVEVGGTADGHTEVRHDGKVWVVDFKRVRLTK